MGKILGLGENVHIGLGSLFIVLFLVGLFSGLLSLMNGDTGTAAQSIGACTVIGLVPGVIFLYFGTKLSRERTDLERLGIYLANKGRATVSEVAAEFRWSEPDAEDRMVTALAENKVAGNFDRGTRQFFTEASMASMEFVAKCGSCGAGIGAWVSRTEPAKCSYCNSEPRPNFVPPAPPAPMVPVMRFDPHTGQPLAQPVMAPVAYMPPAGGAPGYGMPAYGAPQYGTPAYGAPGYGVPPPMMPPGQPAPAYQPPPPAVPPVGDRFISPYVEGAPPPPPAMPRRKRTVKFLFFSMKSGAMKAVGFPVLILGIMILAASIYMSTTPQWVGAGPFIAICSGIFYLPPILIGGALIIRAYREEKYREQLLDIVDYIETYRRMPLNLLAQKMQVPEEKVKKIINDIMEFELVAGYLTPDGSEYIISLRAEDVKVVRACPNCRNPNINIQVIRGGSEKCPYCSGLIYFQEGS